MTKRAAEGLYGMPRLASIESWHPFVLGRSDLATAANKAAAGARARSGLALEGTAGRTGGRARLLEEC